MQLPLPGGQPTNYHGGAAAAGPAIAMPPTPPEMLSRSAGHEGCGVGWETQARASGEAVGVAWLGVAETAAASTNQEGGAAAAAAAPAGDRHKREMVELTPSTTRLVKNTALAGVLLDGMV